MTMIKGDRYELTQNYILNQLDSWKTIGKLLHESGHGGEEKSQANLEKMLKELEAKGKVFSFARGKYQTMNYILSEKLSVDAKARYNEFKNREPRLGV